MSTRKRAAAVATVLSITSVVTTGPAMRAQPSGGDDSASCRPAQVIPTTALEPSPRLLVEPPLAEPLSTRGVVIIRYCAENMRIAPIFGPGALAVAPRVGHIHVTVDESPWHWADASGTPIIVRGLLPGAHTLTIELVDANHTTRAKSSVAFEVPGRVRD